MKCSHTPNCSIRFTSNDDVVYAIVLNWPSGDVITLGSVRATANTAIAMLGDETVRDLQVRLMGGILCNTWGSRRGSRNPSSAIFFLELNVFDILTRRITLHASLI